MAADGPPATAPAVDYLSFAVADTGTDSSGTTDLLAGLTVEASPDIVAARSLPTELVENGIPSDPERAAQVVADATGREVAIEPWANTGEAPDEMAAAQERGDIVITFTTEAPPPGYSSHFFGMLPSHAYVTAVVDEFDTTVCMSDPQGTHEVLPLSPALFQLSVEPEALVVRAPPAPVNSTA